MSPSPKIVLKEAQKTFSSQRKKEQEKVQFGFASTYFTLLSIIACLLIYYVWILNANATQGYTIRQLEKTQNELKIELERLDVKIAELESLETITSDEMYDQMVPINDPDYVVIRDGVQYVYNNN